MPNIATVLKEEIVRLARKEVRSETENLKKASSQYRSDIAALKRRVASLEKQISQVEKKTVKKAVIEADPEQVTRMRFSAKGLIALRQKLGLSAPNMARLLSVSPQTIYNWEHETTRPRAQQVAAIAALRGLGKREVSARLKDLADISKSD